MALRIAFDMDGVLADMDGAVMQHSGQQSFWKHVGETENFWQSLEEIEPGSVERISEAATEGRWEVIFLTRRPKSAGATAQVQTQRWLEAHGFALPSVYVVQGSRGLIAASLHLDVVVDDRPENCLDIIADSKARPILVWRAEQQGLPAAIKKLGVTVVSSMDECLGLLAVEAQPDHKRGVVAGLKRLLGLRTWD